LKTFKVDDNLPVRIKVYSARPELAKCGGAKCHKGLNPTGF